MSTEPESSSRSGVSHYSPKGHKVGTPVVVGSDKGRQDISANSKTTADSYSTGR